MPSEKEVYAAHAKEYERLIQREDYQGNILKEIELLLRLDGLNVADLGAGTGRVSGLLAPQVNFVHAFDSSAHMLAQAADSLEALGLNNWKTTVADHRKIPLDDESVDLVISGWSFCYLAVWGGEGWRNALEAGLAEIERILKPGGTAIILETQGTGVVDPTPPAHLSGYFAFLAEAGFGSRAFRTDYRFESLAEAVELSNFFFGEEMGKKVITNQWQILPEWTGIFWRRKS